MEKKTIGKFISALRRANGMTQRELGEKLFVSDKTVSRWECDECTPDLNLIPTIAEIFGVTTDELLRGERNSPVAEVTAHRRERSDKQFQLMLHNRRTRFRNQSMIAIGVAVAAVILALVINVSFTKGVLAFGIGAVTIIAGLVCQLCFASSAMLRPEDDEVYDTEIRRANSGVVKTTCGVVIAIVSIFFFVLPMALFGGAYYGLSAGAAVLMGLLFAGIALVACYVAYMFCIRKILEKRDLIRDDEIAAQRYRMDRNLLKRMTAIALIIALVLGGCFVGVSVVGSTPFAEKRTFTDMGEFQTFMRQEAIRASLGEYGTGMIGSQASDIIRNENGEVTDAHGNVVGTYVEYAASMVSWDYDEETGDVIKWTVYTTEAMQEGYAVWQGVLQMIGCLMVLDIFVCAIVYVAGIYRGRKKTAA